MELNVHTGKNDYRERFNNSLSRAPISDQAPPGSEFEVFNTPCCKDASFTILFTVFVNITGISSLYRCFSYVGVLHFGII